MARKPVGTGGKGNLGHMIERDPKVVAAGVPSLAEIGGVPALFQQYKLQDEVDSLLSDAIEPPPKPTPLPPMRHPPPQDMRNAGPYSAVGALINPPIPSKFQALVEDFKNTSYASYWNKRVGKERDPTPMFPAGFDISKVTFGKKSPPYESLFDIMYPINPNPDLRPARRAGYQANRNYCSFNPNLIYGHRSQGDNTGRAMKCALTDDRITVGTNLATPIVRGQADFLDMNKGKMGSAPTPCDNISCLPKGHAFGKVDVNGVHVPDCLTKCEINPERMFFLQCLAHLNSLRKVLCTRLEISFFRKFYLELKYIDAGKTGWLPKDKVYEMFAIKNVRFNPALIEPLLKIWNAFDGNEIDYKTFLHILNFKQPLPTIPKFQDILGTCTDMYTTTYREMVKPGQESDDRWMAGIPSGRYFDEDFPTTPEGYCLADRQNLPEESSQGINMYPSVFTLFGISHRDMYENRSRETIKRVFEAAGEEFPNNKFDIVWDEAKKHHSQGWVCYETFRRALIKIADDSKKQEQNTTSRQ